MVCACLPAQTAEAERMAEMTYEDRKRLALADMTFAGAMVAAHALAGNIGCAEACKATCLSARVEFVNACAEEEAEAAKQPKGVCTWTKMGNGNRDTSCGRETSLWAEGICPYCGKEIKPA
jgi:Tfp pilus assembly protein PilX